MRRSQTGSLQIDALVSLATSCFNRKLYAKSSTGKQIAHSAWLEGQPLAQTAFLSRGTSTSCGTCCQDLPLAMLDGWNKSRSRKGSLSTWVLCLLPKWVYFSQFSTKESMAWSCLLEAWLGVEAKQEACPGKGWNLLG